MIKASRVDDKIIDDNMGPTLKLHKRTCWSRVRRRDNGSYVISLFDYDYHAISLPSWEIVSLWYQLGEYLDVDREDARWLLEQKHWRGEY